jgi:hypothetical protein
MSSNKSHFDTVRKSALEMPDVGEGTTYGSPASLRLTDRSRPVPLRFASISISAQS